MEFVDTLATLKPNAMFATLVDYKADNGEEATHNVIFHFSYINAVKKSIEELNSLYLTTDEEITARDELIASLEKTLSTPMKDKDEDQFERFFNVDGEPIPGVRRHKGTGNLHVYALAHKKHIKTPGITKPVKDTAKNRLRAATTVSKFRAFVIAPNKLSELRVSGMTITA
jgi:hypothetical protein